MSSLHQASITGNIEIVKLLIENGAKIDLKDSKGNIALHYAATHGKLDILSTLILNCGSNLNQQTFNGDTVLHLAVQSGHLDVVYQLLHYGCDVNLLNTQFKSALDIACELGKTKIVDVLLQSGLYSSYLKDSSRDMIDSQLSTTCLHLASRNNHTDIIRLLLIYGFDINRFIHQGNALHEACRYGRYQAAKILLECGIDMYHCNFNDQTPMDVIIKQKVGNDIKCLIKEFSEALFAISIDAYLDNHAGALNFNKNEYITVLEKNPTGHWRGFILQNDYQTRYGYFPSSFVNLIDRSFILANSSSTQNVYLTSTNMMQQHKAQLILNRSNSSPTKTCLNINNNNRIMTNTIQKLARYSSTVSSTSTTVPSYTNEKITLDEITCTISPVGSIDSLSKLSLLSNTADSGIAATTSQKSLTTCNSSPPLSTTGSARNSTIDRNIYNNVNAMLAHAVVNSQFAVKAASSSSVNNRLNTNGIYSSSTTSSPMKPTSINDELKMSHHVDSNSIYSYNSQSSPTTITSSSPSMSINGANFTSVNVTDLLLSGLNESQIIYNWLNEVNLEMYYENFVNSCYDLLTIMKMTPSDLCAIGISEPMHRKILIKQMKRLSINDLDDKLSLLLQKSQTIKQLLEFVHLEQYYETIMKQGYKLIEDLFTISCEDLEEIGIRKLGHQKKFMLIIKRLQQVTHKEQQQYYNNNNNNNQDNKYNNKQQQQNSPSSQIINKSKVNSEMYATIRKPTTVINNNSLTNMIIQPPKVPVAVTSSNRSHLSVYNSNTGTNLNGFQMNCAKSLENLTIDELVKGKNGAANLNDMNRKPVSNNKPIPPKRTDSIIKNSQECLMKTYNCNDNAQLMLVNNQQQINSERKVAPYATLPRRRSLNRNFANKMANNMISNNNANQTVLPFANENVGTIKLKEQNQSNQLKQQQLCHYNHYQEGNTNVKTTNYLNNNNLNHRNSQKNDNVLNDIDCMLNDLNNQLEAMLDYEKQFN